MNNFFLHVYSAIRYGEWDWGYEDWKGKPKFALLHMYYDGDHVALHLGKFHISVVY